MEVLETIPGALVELLDVSTPGKRWMVNPASVAALEELGVDRCRVHVAGYNSFIAIGSVDQVAEKLRGA